MFDVFKDREHGVERPVHISDKPGNLQKALSVPPTSTRWDCVEAIADKGGYLAQLLVQVVYPAPYLHGRGRRVLVLRRRCCVMVHDGNRERRKGGVSRWSPTSVLSVLLRTEYKPRVRGM
jgi:hypothetical protein